MSTTATPRDAALALAGLELAGIWPDAGDSKPSGSQAARAAMTSAVNNRRLRVIVCLLLRSILTSALLAVIWSSVTMRFIARCGWLSLAGCKANGPLAAHGTWLPNCGAYCGGKGPSRKEHYFRQR